MILSCITVVILLGLIVFGYLEYKDYLKRKSITNSEYLKILMEKVNEVGMLLAAKLATSLVVACLISVVSFRQFWSNDTFHIVFLSSLLLKPARKYIGRIFDS